MMILFDIQVEMWANELFPLNNAIENDKDIDKENMMDLLGLFISVLLLCSCFLAAMLM